MNDSDPLYVTPFPLPFVGPPYVSPPGFCSSPFVDGGTPPAPLDCLP